MNLRHLRYFVTLAQEANFNRAAERLQMAQPPLSRAIQQLEAEIGKPLVDRSTRPLKLTAHGRILYSRAVAILEGVDELHSALEETASPQPQRLVIGYAPHSMDQRLADVINAFRYSVPHVTCVLEQHTEQDLSYRLEQGSIDIALNCADVAKHDIKPLILRHQAVHVALPARHPLALGDEPITLESLRSVPYIHYHHAGCAKAIDTYRNSANMALKCAQETHDLAVAIALVAAGEGYAFCPETTPVFSYSQVTYRPLNAPLSYPVCLHYRADAPSPAVLAMLRVVARKYAEWGYPAIADMPAF